MGLDKVRIAKEESFNVNDMAGEWESKHMKLESLSYLRGTNPGAC